jgi:hypothetical protein
MFIWFALFGTGLVALFIIGQSISKELWYEYKKLARFDRREVLTEFGVFLWIFFSLVNMV